MPAIAQPTPVDTLPDRPGRNSTWRPGLEALIEAFKQNDERFRLIAEDVTYSEVSTFRSLAARWGWRLAVQITYAEDAHPDTGRGNLRLCKKVHARVIGPTKNHSTLNKSATGGFAGVTPVDTKVQPLEVAVNGGSDVAPAKTATATPKRKRQKPAPVAKAPAAKALAATRPSPAKAPTATKAPAKRVAKRVVKKATK